MAENENNDQDDSKWQKITAIMMMIANDSKWQQQWRWQQMTPNESNNDVGVNHNAHNEKNWSNAHYRKILTLGHTQVSMREKFLFHVNISLPTVDPQLEICP